MSTAIDRRRLVAAALQRTIALLRELDPKDINEARTLFSKWFDRQLESDFRRRYSDDLNRLIDTDYPATELESAKWRCDKRIGRTKLESEACLTAHRVSSHAGIDIDIDYFTKLIMHGLHEVRHNIRPKRDRGDFSDEINDRVVREALEPIAIASAHVEQSTKAAEALTLDEAIKRFLREHSPTIRPKTLREYDQTFRLAVDFWNGAHPVSKIDKPSARQFKDLLLELPTNMTQRFPGKSLQEAVSAAKTAGIRPIAAKTINKKISNISTLFNWLKDQGYVDDNPFNRLSVKDTGERRKRDPFNPDQLQVLFSEGIFANGNVDRTDGASWQDLENFWIPLIGLFTGMRLGEITQLAAADVRQVQGVWVFDVNDRSDNQLKTDASNRLVPVHQELIDVGLLSYRTAVLAEGKSRLFPAIKKASDGYESSAFSKRFGRYLTKCGAKTSRRITYHSFRHTMKDMMREAGIDGSVQQAICGHDDGSVQAVYGNGYTATALLLQLHKIDVLVDLRHLRRKAIETVHE